MCLALRLKDDHKCFESNSKSDCVICGLELFSSRQSIEVLKCGHMIHLNCFNNMLTHSQYACPLCKKSMVDMAGVWASLDLEIAQQPMPADFADAKERVLYNDCSVKSEVPFHWIGQKCSNAECGGYNTTVLDRIGRWPTREQMIAAAQQQQLQRQQEEAQAQQEAQQEDAMLESDGDESDDVDEQD